MEMKTTEEKLLFKVKDLYFSLNYKDWKKCVLASTDLNVWLRTQDGWIKFPNDKLSIQEVKKASGDSSVLIMYVGDKNKAFLGGKQPIIYSLYNALMSFLPTKADTLGAIKFTDSKRLVLRALYQGVRRPENIMPLVKREYDEIVKILEEFEREGICTKAGILTEKGRLIMMEEGYK
jgi:hypothetical protein